MKKGKITMTITIGLACFVLVAVMMMQFKLVNETDITSIETMRETELEEELANWKSKYEETNEKYNETLAKIEEFNQIEQSNEEANALIEEELEQANTILGLTDVTGEGIIVTLRNSEDDGIAQITADNLMLIVNDLKGAGAEAISINDERIITSTDIVYINGTDESSSYIKINGNRVLAPYIIKAIGNSAYLESSLTGNGGQVDKLIKIGHSATIEKPKSVTIKKYNKEIKTTYIE